MPVCRDANAFVAFFTVVLVDRRTLPLNAFQPVNGVTDDRVRLTNLYVQNLRVLQQVQIDTDAELVVFSGLNGSGKTSLLEAINLLGTGRSFRSHTIGDVVRRHSDRLIVRGQVIDQQFRQSTIGVEKKQRGGTRFRINGEEIRSTSILAHHLPLMVVTPDSQRILTDGGEARRKLLDWLMFHVEPEYNQLHKRYRRALKQRNSALRQPGTQNHNVWDEELGSTGEALHALREQHLSHALRVLAQVLGDLLRITVDIVYQPGWDEKTELRQLLNQTWSQDCRRGFTVYGPHRADLLFLVEGRKARNVLSRGESKLLTVAILLGLSKILAQSISQTPVLLVDELASELDHQNRERFFSALKATGAQIFVTAVSDDLVCAPDWSHVLYYQVVQGGLQKVLK